MPGNATLAPSTPSHSQHFKLQHRLCDTTSNQQTRTLTAAPGLSSAAVLEVSAADVPHADCSLWPTDSTLGQCDSA